MSMKTSRCGLASLSDPQSRVEPARLGAVDDHNARLLAAIERGERVVHALERDPVRDRHR
jgi:hypothetical protein